jgi:hypothetical protein
VQLEKDQSKSRLWLYAAFGALFVIAVAIALNIYTIRSATKWFAFSHHYKAEVLAQPDVTGELKHTEWDGWGWAGQDTTVLSGIRPHRFLVNGSARTSPGKFNGIPCEVSLVDRMEKNWYAVSVLHR